MHRGSLEVLAPERADTSLDEAQVLGSAVWLWMHSSAHRDAPLHSLPTLLLPAIKARQFILMSEGGRPVFFLSWLNLSAEAEARYLSEPAVCLPPEDWNSGDRMWVNDWVAPFGHTPRVMSLLRRRVWATRICRSLYHRGEERGLRVMNFQGIAVLDLEAKAWFATHPLPSDAL
ncbi:MULTISPECIES: toxin-activating lysine-acyltransferase [Pseudomonas]|jgi:cytolysin-activating lysine-acyltransferase|uniref:RTX toxin-activating lysine-acyltransferase n=1 Tax=Pseudomonas azadiae TaxID=2843612 RepID=A0ABS6NUE3_9PSED|nr:MULTISPECIES: toxin-activating lysine-acyltransferase [Pseudomonas]MBV4451837.1 toxin-activating lysine-acyltransferase [Pseudomonas azadiae]NMF43061.1 toxin-activating lysine-acyltransferase [Pseudomonas sp. SWRI 103]